MQLFRRRAAVALRWSDGTLIREGNGARTANQNMQQGTPNALSVCSQSHIASRGTLDRASGQYPTEQITIGNFIPQCYESFLLTAASACRTT
jgi:hypothetical protein